MCIPPPTVDRLVSLVTVAAGHQNHPADFPERGWGASSCYRRVKDGECAEHTTLPPTFHFNVGPPSKLRVHPGPVCWYRYSKILFGL